MPAIPLPLMKRITRTLADLAGWGDLDGKTMSDEDWHQLQGAARDARDIIGRLPRVGPKKALPGVSIKAKKKAKRDDYAALRAKVRAEIEPRAKGHCECCHAYVVPREALQMDEFRGGSNRRKLTNRVNCWLLCARCHDDKTHNRPSRAAWVKEYVGHLDFNGIPVPPELR